MSGGATMYNIALAELQDALRECDALTVQYRDAAHGDAAEAVASIEHVNAQLRYVDALSRARAVGSEAEAAAWDRAFRSYRSTLAHCVDRVRDRDQSESWGDLFPAPADALRDDSGAGTARKLFQTPSVLVAEAGPTVAATDRAGSAANPRTQLLAGGATATATATAATVTAAAAVARRSTASGRAELLAEVEDLAQELKQRTQGMFATLRDDNEALDAMARLIEHDLATGKRANSKAEALVQPSIWGSLGSLWNTISIVVGVLLTIVATRLLLATVGRRPVYYTAPVTTAPVHAFPSAPVLDDAAPALDAVSFGESPNTVPYSPP